MVREKIDRNMRRQWLLAGLVLGLMAGDRACSRELGQDSGLVTLKAGDVAFELGAHPRGPVPYGLVVGRQRRAAGS